MSMDSEREERISVVVGLGNPGREYEATRHNVGFMVVDRLVSEASVALQERKFRAMWGSGEIEGRKILLIKPSTYMNRSGEAVAEILKYFGKAAAEMIVVHDDLDLPCGRVKVARRGGAGGHRGVASIIQHLGHQDFPRLKLGIGRPLHGEPVEVYVLEPPYKDQRPELEDMVTRGVEVARAILSAGVGEAMNRYN
jgi:PTH1 family peptidyl-tRNA hydrolase